MSDAYTFVKRRQVGNASAKLVLYAIAEYANESGISQPSSARLREDTELSARTISSSLDLLEEKKIIRRERAHNEKGRRAANRIVLIGYREWLRKLRADNASSDGDEAQSAQVQDEHVQESHVQQAHVKEDNVRHLHLVKPAQDVAENQGENASEAQDANPAHAIRRKVQDITSNVETGTNESLFYVEGAMPKRRSKAWKAEVERVTEALWFTWPLAARKRHTRQAVFDAVESVLSNIKLNARGDDLIAAGTRHVAERAQSPEEARFVKGLVPFLTKGLWQNWAVEDEPYTPPVDDKELRRRRAIFEHDGYWKSDWGPKPMSNGNGAHP